MRMLLVCLLAAATSCTAAPTPQTRARAIESTVWSPYCAGRLLSECTTPQANDLRAEIERRTRAGQSDARVLRWLRSNYGDEILARPRPGAVGAFVWLVPLLFAVGGAALVWTTVRRWRRRPPEAVPEADAPDELRRRVRDEVERGL